MKKDTKYYESFCKKILEIKYNKFINLEIKDRPDIVGNNIGIEVTRAIKMDDAHILSFFNKYKDLFYEDLPIKELQSMGFNTAPKVNESNQVFYSQRNNKLGELVYILDKKTNKFKLSAYLSKSEPDFVSLLIKSIITSIEMKLIKLNKNYDYFEENDLAIILDEQINYFFSKDIIACLFEKLIMKIKEIYQLSKYKFYFHYIYVIFLDEIIEISTKEWLYKSQDITQHDWNVLQLN